MNYPSKKIWAIIGARSGSKGIKDKNIVDLAGKPLIVHSIETALAVPEVDRVIVSTDSEEYGSIAWKCGAEVVLRPSKIAQDDTPDYPWIKHLIKNSQRKAKLLVLLRPTTPLRDPKVVSRAIKVFLLANEATSMRSVHQMAESAWKTFQIGDDGYLTGIVGMLRFDLSEEGQRDNCMEESHRPRQQYDKTYVGNGYVDILRVGRMLTLDNLYGSTILPFITSRVTEVDTPEDLEYLRYEVNKNLS